jgi:predicted dehydrogenase
MRSLVVGLGSIGKRHLGNLRAILPGAEIIVWRQHGRAENDLELHPQANRFVYSLGEAIDTQPEIALITNPASCHIETGLELARSGMSLLIEKPLSNTTVGVHELIELCASRSLTLMVGYNLRFQPAMQVMRQQVMDGAIGQVLCLLAEVGQYLPDWRPESDYSLGVSAQSQLGGGVVLELSHELDYVRWLMGDVKKVSAQTKKLSDLKLNVEDTANIQLTFMSGALGNIHMNMIQRDSSRTCKLIGTEGTLIWNGISNMVSLYSVKTKTWHQIFEEKNSDRNEMFVNELKYFLDCVATGSKPLITGEDGLRVLEIALAAHKSSRLQKTVTMDLL